MNTAEIRIVYRKDHPDNAHLLPSRVLDTLHSLCDELDRAEDRVAELERDIATGDNFVREQAAEIRALRATVGRVRAALAKAEADNAPHLYPADIESALDGDA